MVMTINSDLNPANTIVKDMIAQVREKNEAINQEHREMLGDFYAGRQYKEEYLRNFGLSRAKIPLTYVNLTRKIINKISLVYKNAPDRRITGEENDPYISWLEEQEDFNPAMKRAERKKNLYHNILFRPMWYNGRWNFWIETEWIPYFREGDPLKPFAYSIPVKRDVTMTDRGKIEEKQWYMFWSDEYYYWHDEDGEKKYDPQFPDGRNPFGMLPFIELRKEDPDEEYWPEGSIDLVAANMAINVALNNLNYTVRFQSFNQPYVTGADRDMAQTIRFGQDEMVALSDPQMQLGLLQYSPQIDAAINAIKANIDIIGQAYNVSIKWSLDGSAPSGFSLIVQNIDLMEAREDDVEYAKMYEKRIYDIIQRQDEVLKLGAKLPKREKGTKLYIDFHEINFPIMQSEEIQRLEFEFRNNISTPVDVIQSKEGLTQEEAEERFKRNKELNLKLSPRQEIIRQAIGAQIE